MGKWNYEAMAKSYLMYFKPVGLLACAGWPGAAQNDYNQFWAERFCVAVPQALVDLLFPFLPAVQAVRSTRQSFVMLEMLYSLSPMSMCLMLHV